MKQDRKKSHLANASYLFVWTISTDSSSQNPGEESKHHPREENEHPGNQENRSRIRDRSLENGDNKDPDREPPNPYPGRKEMPMEDPLDNPEVDDPDYPEREETPSPDDVERGDSPDELGDGDTPDERGIFPDEEDEDSVTN